MSTSSDDIVALGGNLEPATLREAYRNGVFPWPAEDLPLLWFCPRERAILEYRHLHVGRSLARARRQTRCTFTLDTAFEDVILTCASEPRPGQDGTWITDEMIEAYVRLHRLGVAHSVEAWLDGRLVGGLYGVDTDGAFSAESMFYHEPWASKLALLHLLDHLAARGLDWIDIQVMTPHMERLGARNITRREFLARLRRTRALGLALFDPLPAHA
ncbi:leucyl/phenylalanyl-tRNA--protein transferase [Candidatus Binatia bacterium]|jgi:leucyl/phenylalanyl-tRNA--protein transferase|nr:leucyl/phenylalanyl-tRNA--protein transferase [Candidatus Binatia bacterium]